MDMFHQRMRNAHSSAKNKLMLRTPKLPDLLMSAKTSLRIDAATLLNADGKLQLLQLVQNQLSQAQILTNVLTLRHSTMKKPWLTTAPRWTKPNASLTCGLNIKAFKQERDNSSASGTNASKILTARVKKLSASRLPKTLLLPESVKLLMSSHLIKMMSVLILMLSNNSQLL